MKVQRPSSIEDNLHKHTISHLVSGKWVVVSSETLESAEPQQRLVNQVDDMASQFFPSAASTSSMAISYKVDTSLEHYVHSGYFLSQFN